MRNSCVATHLRNEQESVSPITFDAKPCDAQPFVCCAVRTRVPIPSPSGVPTQRNGRPELPLRHAGSYGAGERYHPRGKRFALQELLATSFRCHPHSLPSLCHSARIIALPALPSPRGQPRRRRESGDCSPSPQLYHDMTRHSRVSAVLH